MGVTWGVGANLKGRIRVVATGAYVDGDIMCGSCWTVSEHTARARTASGWSTAMSPKIGMVRMKSTQSEMRRAKSGDGPCARSVSVLWCVAWLGDKGDGPCAMPVSIFWFAAWLGDDATITVPSSS